MALNINFIQRNYGIHQYIKKKNLLVESPPIGARFRKTHKVRQTIRCVVANQTLQVRVVGHQLDQT